MKNLIYTVDEQMLLDLMAEGVAYLRQRIDTNGQVPAAHIIELLYLSLHGNSPVRPISNYIGCSTAAVGNHLGWSIRAVSGNGQRYNGEHLTKLDKNTKPMLAGLTPVGITIMSDLNERLRVRYQELVQEKQNG